MWLRYKKILMTNNMDIIQNKNGKKLNTSDIKNLLLVSLLEYYCNNNMIDNMDIIIEKLSEINIIDKDKLYNSSVKKQILGIIDSFGNNYSIQKKYMNNSLILKGILGTGSTADVFKMYNIIDDTYYAVKKVDVNIIDPVYFKESIILSRLKHPNIVRYHTSWFDNSNNISICIQMELCEMTLKKWLVDRTCINDYEKFYMFYNILLGLKVIHDNNYIHRDIKPTNIMIKDNIPKISDFGLCRIIKHNSVDIIKYKDYTTCIGTELYSSPEQLNGECYDERTDLYSLGIIYFELCMLFDNNMKRIDSINLLRTGKFKFKDNNINRSDARIINKLINKCPDNRLSLDKLIDICNKKLKK